MVVLDPSAMMHYDGIKNNIISQILIQYRVHHGKNATSWKPMVKMME